MTDADKLGALLKDYADSLPPEGFAARVSARAAAQAPDVLKLPDRLISLRESGILCIACGLILFVTTRTPVVGFLSALIQSLGGLGS